VTRLDDEALVVQVSLAPAAVSHVRIRSRMNAALADSCSRIGA